MMILNFTGQLEGEVVHTQHTPPQCQSTSSIMIATISHEMQNETDFFLLGCICFGNSDAFAGLLRHKEAEQEPDK